MPAELFIEFTADEVHQHVLALRKEIYLANKARRARHAARIAARKVYRKRMRRGELWRYENG